METREAIFAAGCFWGVEASFRSLPGVIDTEVGYTGGSRENPTYGDVCRGDTGHAEAVRVVFDPARIAYGALLKHFFSIHDPTTKDRQGPDVGSQYRSAIFYTDEAQKEAAVRALAELTASGAFGRPIVTEVAPAGVFYKAEEYHQRYLEKTGRAVCR